MKININELPEYLSEKDMTGFEELFADIEKDAEISDEQQQHILSSVMRKAGNAMDTMIKDNSNITAKAPNKNVETVSDRIHLKRGGAIAACIAVLAVGGALFSINNKFNSTVPNNVMDSSVTNERESALISKLDSSETGSEDPSEAKEPETTDSDNKSETANPDTVGYIRINDLTDRGAYESPVVQGEDNAEYLYNNFNKEYDEKGIVFADAFSPIDENGQTSNLILYGYFTDKAEEPSSSPLLKYEDSTFFEQHKTIDFCTIYDEPDTKYQVLYCCRYNVYEEYETDHFIRIRNFNDENTGNISFEQWISNLNKWVINKSDIECSEDDDYIMLCSLDSDAGEDMRVAVVAKKIKDTSDEETSAKESTKDDKANDSNAENRI